MKKIILAVTLLVTISIAFGQKKVSSQTLKEFFSNEKAIYLNDTIWVLDSTLQQRLVEDEFVNQRKRIIQSHDEQGRNTSSLWKSWHSSEETWLKSSYDSAIFHTSGAVSDKFSYDWNTNENNWKLTFLNKISENEIQIERIQLNWDNDRNKYLHGFRQWTEFNEAELPLISFWDDFDSIIQDYTTTKRTVYFYNENSQDTSKIWEKWNKNSQTWEAYIKADFAYNEGGELVQRVDFVREDGEWINSFKNIINYNSAGLVDTNSFYSWLTVYNMWYPANRYISFYDVQERIIESIKQIGTSSEDSWINESRGVIIFENDVLTKKLTYKWVSGSWEDNRIELRTYVDENILESQTFINYNPYNDVYDTSTRWLTIFNDKYIPERFLSQRYSTEFSEFITYLQSIYYFSPLLVPTGVYENKQFDFTVYPNPTSGIFQLSLHGHDNASITVSGLTGNIVYKGITNSKNIRIDLSNQAKGMYFIHVVSGKQQGVRKVLKL